MRKDFTIGLVVPFAADAVPDEGLQMYPDVRFIPRGVGVRSLTPTGYDSACEAILPAAEALAAQGVDAIMVIGTSLTFYRGSDFHDRLMERLRNATGLPVSTMSQAVVDGLRSFGARRIVVATAYADDVNDRLQAFLTAHGFEVLALEGFGLFGFGEPGNKSEADIIALGSKVCAQGQGAEGLLISCGGLRTLGWPSRSSSATAFRSSRALRRRSGRRCGSSVRTATSPGAGGSWRNQQPPLCTDAFCAKVRRGMHPVRIGADGPAAACGPGDWRHIPTAPYRNEGLPMKARVTVTLKFGILDPQGKAIEGALRSLGVNGVASVRQGKVFDIEIEGDNRTQAEAALRQAADKLLANTLIENYDVKLIG